MLQCPVTNLILRSQQVCIPEKCKFCCRQLHMLQRLGQARQGSAKHVR